MSKIINPGPKAIPVARWVIAPNGSAAQHSLTGEQVAQLPEKVANSTIVRSLVDQGVLVEEGAVKKEPVVRAPVKEQPADTAPVTEAASEKTAKAKKKES